MEVSAKSTKAELLKHIEEQNAKLKAMADAKADSQAIAKKREDKRIVEEAQLSTTEGMLQGVQNLVEDFHVLVEEYKNLQAATEIKKAELKELHGIEEDLLNMEAIHNALVDIQVECQEATNTLQREKQAELKRITAEHNEKVAALDKEYKAAAKETEALRKRTEEEYQYQLQKAHREQKDKLEAELADMRKTTHDYCDRKEAEIKAHLEALEVQAVALAHREKDMSILEEQAENAYEEGYAKAKADAAKDYAFEKKTLEAKHDKEEALLKAELKAAEHNVKDLEARVKAYEAQMSELRQNQQNLAEKVVEASKASAPVFVPMGGYNEQPQSRGK